MGITGEEVVWAREAIDDVRVLVMHHYAASVTDTNDATVPRGERERVAGSHGASIEGAQKVLMREVTPIDDLRSTADYRRRVCANLLARWWSDTSEGGGS